MNQKEVLEKKIRTLESRLEEMELYRTFVEEARGGQGFFRHDISGIITYINSNVSAILETPATDIVGRYWRNVVNVSERDKTTIKSSTLDLYAGKEHPKYTIDYTTPTGTLKVLEIQQGPLRNPDGKLIAVYGSISDVTAQHQSRKKINELAQRLELTWKSFDAISTVGIGIVKNRKLFNINLKLGGITGYSLDELTGIDLRRLYLTEEHYINAGKALYTSDSPDGWTETESKWLRKDGKVIDCLIRVKPMMTDPEDSSTVYMALAQDITHRKRAEATITVLYDIIKALNSTEDLDGLINSIYDSLERLIDTTNIYIAIYNADEDRISFPYYRDEDEIREIDKAGSSGSITAKVIKSGKPLLLNESDLKTLYSMGSDRKPIGKCSRVWLGVPLKIKNEIIGVLAVQSYSDPKCYTMDDIPLLESVSGYIASAINRRRQENDLRESEQRYRDLFEQTSDFIYIHDLDGNFINSNLEYKQDLYPDANPEELIIQNVKHVLFPEHISKFDNYISRILENGFDKGLMTIRTKITKNEMIIEYNNRLIRDASGNPQWVQGSARDVTVQFLRKREKSAMEKQLLQAQKMEAIGTLTSGIAHDFNNILFIILSYAQLGEEIETDDTTRSFFSNINKSAARARDLINQLLIFSRPLDDVFHPIDISTNIKEVLKLVRASIPSSIEIRHKITPNVGYINGDPTRIHQVIMNLVTNAFQSITSQKGVIEVRLSAIDLEYQTPDTGYLAPGKYIELIVKDTGTGMDQDTLERIYEPFFTTKEVGVGTGLGLSTVHGIVKHHEGHIYVNSEPGRGTVFKVYFPEIIKSKIKKPETPVDVKGGNETILVVDDEPLVADMYRAILERFGYNADVVTESRQAYSLFRDNPDHYDLILSDHTMPEMTGIELSEKIRSLRQDIPIIMVTGFYGGITKQERNAYGINSILLKPVNKNDLLNSIRSELDTLN